MSLPYAKVCPECREVLIGVDNKMCMSCEVTILPSAERRQGMRVHAPCAQCFQYFTTETGSIYCAACAVDAKAAEKTAIGQEGIKHDGAKPDLSMISFELLEEVAYVRMFGAKKYERDNWKKGFKVSRSCAAALRHIYQFLSGETNDPESGRLHLAHAVCALEHAIYDMKKHPENDDRSKE